MAVFLGPTERDILANQDTYIHTLLACPKGAFQSQIYIIQLKPKYMTMIKRLRLKKIK